MVKIENDKYLIQSVSMACFLLEQFYGGEEHKVTDLSRLLSISKNNVFRLLATLELHNFVEKNPITGMYRLGVTNLKLGAACLRNKRLEHESRLFMEDVSSQCLETTILTVVGKEGLVCVDVVDSRLPVRVTYHAGTILPLHCSSGEGRNIESNRNKTEGVRGWEYVKPDKKQTIAFIRVLAKHLRDVREKGFALSIEGLEIGVNGVAAPVRNHTSRIIGMIGVVGPSFRLTHDRLNDDVAPLVVRAAREISSKMGYVTPVTQDIPSQVSQTYCSVSRKGATLGLRHEKRSMLGFAAAG